MRKSIFGTLLLLCCLISSAKDKVQIATEPNWLFPVYQDTTRKTDVKNVNNGYYYELLDRQTNVSTQTFYEHFIRHIVNETGVQNASEISVTFSPEYQNIIFHYVRVIRNGKIVNRLNLKEIKIVQEETDVNDFQYNGIKRAFIILKDIRKNDCIEVSYSIKGFNPAFGDKFTTELQFNNDNPITNYFETIITEEARKLLLTSFENAPAPTEKTFGNKHIYHWSNPPLKLWESASGTPSWFNKYPYIIATEYNNWKEVADWGVRLFNNYQYDLPTDLKNRMSEWKKNAKGNDDEFARQALRYVQDDIRYLGLEIGVHTHKPHSPDEVFKSGYGDCKDKSLLLAAILQHENIPAYVALLNTYKRGEMYKAAANPGEFNHAIVAIEKPEGYKYIDPTSNSQRGELLDIYLPAYGYALVLRDGETGLRAIEPSSVNSVYIVEQLKVNFYDTSRLSVYTTYRGGSADYMRNSFAGTSVKDMKDAYVNYYAPIFEGIYMPGDISYEEDSVENSVLIKEEYGIPAIWNEDNGEKKKSFSVYAKSIVQQLTVPPTGTEKLPVALKFPYSVQYTLKMEMPENWTMPNDVLHIKNDSYQFDFDIVTVGNKITFKYYFRTFKDHVPAEFAQQYKKDYKNMTDVIEYKLSYTEASGAVTSKGDNVNWIAIWICFFTFVPLSFLFRKLNSQNIEVDYDRDAGWRIGGWMVVLGFSLCANLAVLVYSLLSTGYFSENTWNIWVESGSGVLMLVLCELFFLLVGTSFAVAVLYWFLKRRDIFPRMFIWYVGFLISSKGILFALYSTVPYPSSLGDISSESLKEIFRSLVYGAIWCTYLLRSYRTKATFLKSS